MVLGGRDTSPEVVLGTGVIICGIITLEHPQKLTRRRGKADFGTFPDLIHLLKGVERSGLVLGGRDTSPEVVGGSHWGPG